MDKPTPIGMAKFREAKAVQERSKAAISAENKHLQEQQASMQQLLAAILLEFGQESIHLRRKSQLTFDIAHLEALSPEIVGLEIKDGQAVLFLK